MVRKKSYFCRTARDHKWNFLTMRVQIRAHGKKNDIYEDKKEKKYGELSTHRPYFGWRWEESLGTDSSIDLKISNRINRRQQL